MQPNPWQVQANMTGIPAYGGPPRATGPVRAAWLSGTLAIVALVGWLGAAGCVAVADLRLLARVGDRRAGDGTVMSVPLDGGLAVVGYQVVALGAATAVTAVAFCAWLFRARLNAERIGAGEHRWGRLLVIFGWIIPIANLWIPKQVVDDVLSAGAARPSAPEGQDAGTYPPAGRPAGRSWLTTAWWTCWILYFTGGRIVDSLLSDGRRLNAGSSAALDEAHDVAIAGLIGITPGVVAALLAIAIIMRINRTQQAEAERITTMISRTSF